MIGQFKLTCMTVIWPTSRKREQGNKKSTIANLTIAEEIDPHSEVPRSCVMYICLLCTINSNLQDEIAGHDGIRKRKFLQT